MAIGMNSGHSGEGLPDDDITRTGGHRFVGGSGEPQSRVLGVMNNHDLEQVVADSVPFEELSLNAMADHDFDGESDRSGGPHHVLGAIQKRLPAASLHAGADAEAALCTNEGIDFIVDVPEVGAAEVQLCTNEALKVVDLSSALDDAGPDGQQVAADDDVVDWDLQ